MTILLLLPVILSFLLLAAHFMHAGNLICVGIVLLLPFLLLIRRGWVVWILQIALLMGSVEWLWTMVGLIGVYREEGRPWTRMVCILGGVMLFTVASGLVFSTRRLRTIYAGRTQPGSTPASAGGGVCAGLSGSVTVTSSTPSPSPNRVPSP